MPAYRFTISNRLVPSATCAPTKVITRSRVMSARKLSLVAATAVLLVASISLSNPSRAAQLVSRSGSCADIQLNDTNDGTPMILFHCHGTPNENWTLTGGTLSGENGVCLDVLG